MEVHHHPDMHHKRKPFKEYFFGILNDFSCRNTPESIYSFDDTARIAIPGDTKVLIQYNKVLFEQLYSNIRFQKGELIVCIETEKEYFQKVEHLLKLLELEYHLN